MFVMKLKEVTGRYQVIFKKVSFGNFRIILVSKEETKAKTEGYLRANFYDI